MILDIQLDVNDMAVARRKVYFGIWAVICVRD